MKNLLLTLILIFFVFLSYSQNIILGDFEDGTLGGWSTWGAPLSVVNNPDTIGNNSIKVALLDQKGGAWSGMAKWYNTPILKENTIMITVDVFFKNTGGTFKLQMDNSLSGAANFEEYKEIEANIWTNVEFIFATDQILDFKQIAFQSSVADTFFIDNIVMVQGAPIDQTVGNFENQTLQGWSTWGAPLSVVANPLKELNTSNYVAKLDQSGGGWSGMAQWSNTPAFNNEFEGISVDVFYPGTSGMIKLQMDNSVSGAPNVEKYSDSLSAGEWKTVIFDLRELDVRDYRQIAFQSPIADVIYFDNIKLKVSLDIENVNPPENLSSVAFSASQIDLSWKLNPESENVLLAISENEITGNPTKGNSYISGDKLSDGSTIIYNGNATNYNATQLNANTNYYFKLWSISATNAYSEGILSNAKTLFSEPSQHITTFEMNTRSLTSFTIVWEDNQGENPAEGYAMFINEFGKDPKVPTDGVPVTNDIDMSDGYGASQIAPGVETFTWNNLKHSTAYRISMFPYANSGNKIDYKTDSAPFIIAMTKVQTTDPYFVPAATEFVDSIWVKIECDTDFARIFYTTNGATPDTLSARFRDSILVTESTTIKAMAYIEGISSNVVEARYRKADTLTEVEAPYFNPEGGEFADSVEVSIICDTPDAEIYFTTNGEDPTTASAKYTTPILLKQTTNIKAISTLDGVTSEVISANYTVNITPVADPVISPESGEYADSVLVTITCETENAIIYYTTDDTGTWLVYNQPFMLYQSTTIRAKAMRGEVESNINEGIFTITETIHLVEIATIAELHNSSIDETLYLFNGEGVVTFAMDFRGQKYMQDATGAILIDDNNGAITEAYQIGQAITNFTGKLVDYYGLLQFVPQTAGEKISNPVYSPVPVEVSIADFIADFESYESKLIKINGVKFASSGNFEAGKNYTITQQGNEGILRTHFYDADYIGTAIPERTQNIVGIALWNNDEAKIVARSTSDFENTNNVNKQNFDDLKIYASGNKIVVHRTSNNKGQLTITNIVGQIIKQIEVSDTYSEFDFDYQGILIAVYSENGVSLQNQKITIK